MIDVRYLEILKEVKHQGSVTAAADKLHVSQSALSHMIRKLEDRYNTKIWVKHGRNLHFTKAGEYLIQVAERILPQLENAEIMLREYASGMRGHVKVGMECHPCQKWLMAIADPYLEKWKDVRFDVTSSFNFSGINALNEHEIDILITPDPIEHPLLTFQPVFGYELVLVVNREHYLSKKKFIEPRDLVDEELITVPVSVDRLDIFTKFLIPSHCQPKNHVKIETSDLILQLVSHNRGIAVLPDWLVQATTKSENFHCLKIGSIGIQKSIYVGIRKSEQDIDYLKDFIEIAKNTTPILT
ncbi:LysR family transcriptional regulator [Vibrio natriegens]|uniref:LysR family transcriptional regulator n=1 Tax=Vibrio natriegens TaxID=691 RepID=UPI000803D4A0|nr:LysR family transcriptional regulator [Vibrio natriegens]ANQ20223.1 LysR family transcriptional regulator [Vibrio natriegens]